MIMSLTWHQWHTRPGGQDPARFPQTWIINHILEFGSGFRSTLIVFYSGTGPKHPFDNLHDLFRIYGATTISIKGCEDPVELFLDGRHVLHVRGLEPLKEVEGAAVILVKHPEESVIKNIILKGLLCQTEQCLISLKCYFCWRNVAFTCDASFWIFSVKFVIGISYFLKTKSTTSFD